MYLICKFLYICSQEVCLLSVQVLTNTWLCGWPRTAFGYSNVIFNFISSKVVKGKVVTPPGEGENLGGGSGRTGRSRRDTLTEPDIVVRKYFISTFDFNVRHFLFSPRILIRYLNI